MVTKTTGPGTALMICLIIPILPGLSEAWRRFAQELQGPRRQDWLMWQERMKLQCLRYTVQSSYQQHIVLLQVQLAAGSAAPHELSHNQTPFDRWLREQLLYLHGIDLAQIGALGIHQDTETAQKAQRTQRIF